MSHHQSGRTKGIPTVATATIPSAAQAYTVKGITYRVASSKNDGTMYTVTADPSDGRILDCSCPHRACGRKSPCRHMKLAASKGNGGLRPRVRVAMHCREATPPADPRAALALSLYS